LGLVYSKYLIGFGAVLPVVEIACAFSSMFVLITASYELAKESNIDRLGYFAYFDTTVVEREVNERVLMVGVQ
jgi:hypothetical protein